MNLNDLSEEKTRLDPKCWTGKKIGNPKTKMKGGVRVNNCVPAESVAEGASDTVYPGAEVIKSKNGKPVGEIYQDASGWGCHHYNADLGADCIESRAEAIEWLKDLHDEHRQDRSLKEQDMSEEWSEKYKSSINCANPKGFSQRAHCAGKKKNEDVEMNPEYNDEAGMAENNLETLDRAVQGLDNLINSGDNLPEWCQEKIAVAKSMLVAVWDYMESEEDSDEVDPEVDEMFEAMQELAEEMARKNRVSVDRVWESFEALDDHMLYETAAWRRKEGKSKSGGLNAKGVASYRRENPGSKLQTAVTTKPSKLKPGSKAAKRRKSFCARMSGVKGPMKKPNGKPTRKALALRKWNC